MIELIVKKDDREINRYFLPQGITTLGRAEDNGIILDDSCVSRRHAQIKVDGAKVLIEDMNSGNGVYRGDARIEQHELADGDEIVIEPFTLLVRMDAEKGRVADSTRPVPSANRPRSERLDPPPRTAREPGGSAAGGPRLEVLRGAGGPYLLSGDSIVLGRSDEAKITLKDPSSSRKHAMIERSNRGWTVRDLGSANGTYLNGSAIGESPLANGDVILIGNTELRFIDPEAVADDDPAPLPSTRSVAVDRGRAAVLKDEPVWADSVREAEADGLTGAVHTSELFEAGGTAAGGDTELGAAGADDAGGVEDEGYAADGDRSTADFGSIDATGAGDAYGMELEGVAFPGDEVPESIVGRYIYSLKTNRRTQLITGLLGFTFVMILIAGSRGGGGAGGAAVGPQVLDKQQKLTLTTMEAALRQALGAIDPSKPTKDYATAFEYFGRVRTFGSTEEMKEVRDAQELVRTANENIYTLHEALLLARLRDVTMRGAERDRATQERFDRSMRDGKANLDAARRRRSVASYDAALRAFNDVLQIDPENAEIKQLVVAARSERGKIAGEMSKVAKAALERKQRATFDQAQGAMGKRTARGYLEAIRLFERMLQQDPGYMSDLTGRASAEIAAAKKKLRDSARPIKDNAKSAIARQDWLTARAKLRQAQATDPYDLSIPAQLEEVQQECLKNARQQISEAKAYKNVGNPVEARKSLELGLRYADEEKYKENQQIRELLKTISRENER